MAFDWTFPGRAEMVKSALDVLNVCAVLPKAQAQFCEVVDLPEANKPVGINILLSAAEGEIVQVSCLFYSFVVSISCILIMFYQSITMFVGHAKLRLS